MDVHILADDLSGAADCAASFTGAFGAMPLRLRDADPGPPRLALDTDTRSLDESAAAARWRELASSFASAAQSGALLFKKIDSTLRGHVATELSAFLEALPGIERVVVAPAFPEQGRTFVDGRLCVHGKAQEADLEVLRQGIAGGLRGRSLVMPMTVASTEDLRALVDRTRESSPRTLWVGSSGLARALAGTPPRKIDNRALETPVLIAVGSYSPMARAQVRAFAAQRPGQAIAVSARGVNLAAAAARAMDTLQATGMALVHFDPDEAAPAQASRQAVAALAAALRPVAQHARTLVMTGGDTARALLEALGVDALVIEGELEPGLPVSAPVEGHGFRALLKAGGFGDNGVFLRLNP